MPGYFLCNIDIHIASIKISYDFDGRVSPGSPAFAAPLRHPSTVAAFCIVLRRNTTSKNRLPHIRAGKIILKKFIHNPINESKNTFCLEPICGHRQWKR